MAGSGTYVGFDKERVGVYTKFVAKKASDFMNANTQGIVAIGLTMDFGLDGEVTEVLGTELQDGSCVSKIGYTLADEEILPYRLALQGAYKAYFYKLNEGGQKASATIGDITAEALCSGILGNNISLSIKANTPTQGKYCIETFFKGVKKETLYVASGEELLSLKSAWVKFTSASSTPTITPTTGTTLAGGTNGTITADSYEHFFEAVKYKMYDYIACVGADTSISDKIVDFVTKQREKRGKYVCGVVYDRPALNNKYIISVDQGLECDEFTISTALMPVFIASLRAGCPLGACLDNNDMTTLVGARKIINPVDDDGDEAFVEALKQGKFLFAYWNDGTVVVEEDLNTYIDYIANDPVNYPADFRRNRLIATMNYIGNETQVRINKNVVDGKHADDDDGNSRYLVKSIIDDVCRQLKDATVIGNYDPQTDIVVSGAGASDRLHSATHLLYKDSIRQVYNEYDIVLS